LIRQGVETGEKLLPWYYNVWFEGKIVEGYEPDVVIRNLMALYKGRVDFQKILLSGKPVLVEEGISLENAQKIIEAYKKAGAVCWGEVVDIVEAKLDDDLEPYKNSFDNAYVSLSASLLDSLKG
jgi:hypothetical protein